MDSVRPPTTKPQNGTSHYASFHESFHSFNPCPPAQSKKSNALVVSLSSLPWLGVRRSSMSLDHSNSMNQRNQETRRNKNSLNSDPI